MPPPKKKKRTLAAAASNPGPPNPIPDIAPNRVGTVVQSFITNDGVKQMDVNQQSNGHFTVTPLR